MNDEHVDWGKQCEYIFYVALFFLLLATII